MSAIVPSSMTPKVPPKDMADPGLDVLELRINNDATIVQELYRRSAGTIGFRYRAWVNFSDAGGGAHHMWWVIDANEALVTDSLATARQIAEGHASSSGTAFGVWHASAA